MIPHLRVVLAFCCVGMAGYIVMSCWVLIYGDPAMKGDVIGTWKTWAAGAMTLWIARNLGKPQEEIDLDAKRADNQGKLTDLAKTALETPVSTTSDDAAGKAAGQVADAAADEAQKIKGD